MIKDKTLLKEIKKRKKNIFGSPYNFWETLKWVIKTYRGLSKKYEGIVEYIPSEYNLHDIKKKKYKIAFIGDIMDRHGFKLSIGKNLIKFTEGCDYLVGNFEATITDKKGIFKSQNHTPEIMDILSHLFDPNRTILSVANNHAGDFGENIFLDSIKKLKTRGFNVFGYKDKSCFDIDKKIRIITGTEWSNLECNYVPDINTVNDNYDPKKLNILYPHWGYELELYPRPEMVEKAEKWSKNFDVILGHHSHTPQPVTVSNKYGKQNLIGYSLGLFNSGRLEEEKHYGIIIKLEIGPNNIDELKIGKCHWSMIHCNQINSDEFRVDLCKRYPFLKQFS